MSKIKITCDSTGDLTHELYQQYQIRMIPLGISLDDVLYNDGVDLAASDIFSFVERTGRLPKTSSPSIGTYMDVFESYLNQGFQVIHISLSSELSSSYQNACAAAAELGNVFVVDSRSLSSASGLLAIAAAEMAEEELLAVQIVNRLNELKTHLECTFIIQTLDYLHKGGRCPGVAALGANLLKLRPEIIMSDGSMHVGRKFRGTGLKTQLAYIRSRLEGRTDIRDNRIILVSAGVSKEDLDAMRSLVRELQPDAKILETLAGCTISSHCGPNCMGLMFLTE